MHIFRQKRIIFCYKYTVTHQVGPNLLLTSKQKLRFSIKSIYRVSQKVSDLGWVDLDMGSSPGWWAAIVATYCPSRVGEHAKSKSTQPRSETFWDTLYRLITYV